MARPVRLALVRKTTVRRSREIGKTIREAARDAGAESAVAFAIAVVHADGSVGTTYDVDSNNVALLGAVEILRMRVLESFERRG